MNHFRFPHITGRTDAEKIQQMHSYMRQLVQDLNFAMLELSKEDALAIEAGLHDRPGVDNEAISRIESALKNKADKTDLESKADKAHTHKIADISDMKIAYGKASINYGTETTYTNVSFGRTFSTPPAVVTSQVFDNGNIIVRNDDITETGFRVTVAPLGASGSRTVQWIAIGT